VLFILSEFWISTSAPPQRRGLILGVYATVLSLGFAFGPWLFAQVGSAGFAPFGITFALIALAAIPVSLAWRESPDIASSGRGGGGGGFARYIWMVPTATAAVLVFGAVETGGFALFPVYGARIGYSEADAALLLTAVGLGNVLLQIPLGLVSDRMRDRRTLLAICALVGLAGSLALPYAAGDWNLSAAILFVWGGVVAGLYTVGLAHLGSKLSGRDLASANAAFVFCYGVGMLIGPQAIGIGMDVAGPNGFAWTLALFFAAYLLLAGARLFALPARR
jgi:MFS family permease